MRDPFDGEFPISTHSPVRTPRVPGSRPISFDDDDEPTRGIYDNHVYAGSIRQLQEWLRMNLSSGGRPMKQPAATTRRTFHQIVSFDGRFAALCR